MKISTQKRNQLFLVSLLIGGGLVGLYFWLIRGQQQNMDNLQSRKAAAARKLQVVQETIQNAPELENCLREANTRVAKLEDTMATGDLYSWSINMVRAFRLNYKVEIPQFSQIDARQDTMLLPAFPYKQATLAISGTGTFHDFGVFLADFENKFPHIRVINLTLEPVSAALGASQDKLSFKMDIVMLVKPS